MLSLGVDVLAPRRVPENGFDVGDTADASVDDEDDEVAVVAAAAAFLEVSGVFCTGLVWFKTIRNSRDRLGSGQSRVSSSNSSLLGQEEGSLVFLSQCLCVEGSSPRRCWDDGLRGVPSCLAASGSWVLAAEPEAFLFESLPLGLSFVRR